jgi:hypothetical protein
MDMILQSDQLDQLFTALAKAQSEMSVIDRGIDGHFGAFATINDMAKASRPVLTKYGLSVSFDPFICDGKKMLKATLGHSSGQWKSSVIELMLDKQNMQGYGGAITYAIRYAYKSVVGLIVLDKGEVDSETPSKSNEEQQTKPEPTYIPEEQKTAAVVDNYIDKDQLSVIGQELIGFKDIYNVVISEFDRLQNIPKRKFKSVMQYIKTEKGKLI